MGGFRSFVWGGFEGASHRRIDRTRVDALEGSLHPRLAAVDLALLRALGIRTVREALRWHLIEAREGVFDWSSARGQVAGALANDTEVIWDLCHWGVPDGMDVMAPCWPARLARFAAQAARFLRGEGLRVAGWVPVNEMSFWAWAGGQTGGFAPFLHGAGDALKRQLVRGHLAAVAALREAGACEPILVCEPLTWMVADPTSRAECLKSRTHEAASLAAIDAILARDPAAIDVIGLNSYPRNQWRPDGRLVPLGAPGHRPLRDLLASVARRYGRPIALAEIGDEEPNGTAWTDHVAVEIAAARAAGVPIEGACLYPVLDYAGWDDGRHCRCGPLGTERRRRFVRAAHRPAIARLAAAGQVAVPGHLRAAAR